MSSGLELYYSPYKSIHSKDWILLPLENIEFFINEQKLSQDNNHQDDRIIKKNYNFDDTNENFFQQATAAGQSTNYDPQSTLNNFNMWFIQP